MVVYVAIVGVSGAKRLTVTRSLSKRNRALFRGAYSHDCEAVGYSAASEEDAFDLALHEAIRLGIRT